MGRCLFPESILHASGFGGDEDILHINHLPPDELPDTSKVWSHARQFDDGARPDGTTPGKPRTPERQVKFLRGRLKVLELLLKLSGLSGNIVAELERSRLDTAEELAGHEGLKDSANGFHSSQTRAATVL
jgi:hypothetical protein